MKLSNTQYGRAPSGRAIPRYAFWIMAVASLGFGALAAARIFGAQIPDGVLLAGLGTAMASVLLAAVVTFMLPVGGE